MGASKEAIRTLSRTAAAEWGQHGITVNVIAPVIETDAMNPFFRELPADRYADALARIPMGRFGDPYRDAGSLVAFLGGPDARYLTGKSFELDGGMTLKP
jgi:2-hydroxycyclohexanecarboxyl-CoA dehydrogenase